MIETASFTPDPTRTAKQQERDLQQFARKFEDEVKSGLYVGQEGLSLLRGKEFDLLRSLYPSRQLNLLAGIAVNQLPFCRCAQNSGDDIPGLCNAGLRVTSRLTILPGYLHRTS